MTERRKRRDSPEQGGDATAQLAARLARCYTGAVHDVLREMGHENIVLPASIKPIVPQMRVAGPAWTVAGHIDRTRSRHETLLAWCTLLARAPRGHVTVCQPNNHEVALMGELSAQTLQARGVLGFVVDGGSRDTELIVAQGFPVFCAFLTPADVVARWVPDRYGEPVTVGAVTIATGDYIRGDRDGLVVYSRGARRRSRDEDRGSGRHRKRDAARVDRRRGSGRGVQQVRQVLAKPQAHSTVSGGGAARSRAR